MADYGPVPSYALVAGSAPRPWRPTLAALAAAVVTVFCLPIHLALAFLFLTASQSYDTTGSGGPFKSCGSAADCSDPNYGVMLGMGALMAVLWLAAALLGQLAWGPGFRFTRVVGLTVWSAAVAVGGCAIVYAVLTGGGVSFYAP